MLLNFTTVTLVFALRPKRFCCALVAGRAMGPLHGRLCRAVARRNARLRPPLAQRAFARVTSMSSSALVMLRIPSRSTLATSSDSDVRARAHRTASSQSLRLRRR